MNINLKMDAEHFVEIVMQVFLITIVLCTWFLPTCSSIARESLSAILMTYIAAGADISEFFSTINESNVKLDKGLVNGILSKLTIQYFIFLNNFHLKFVQL